jgi:hypothetical protein
VIGVDATDGIFIVILILGVAVLAAALVSWRKAIPDHRRTSGAWQSGIASVCAAGREVIDLTAAPYPGEPGTGLTVDQLSLIESRLDLLVGRISDVQSIAPTREAAQRMSRAASHASSLNEALRTERRVRLSSTPSATQKLDTITVQFVSERSALDDVLGEICRGSIGTQ